MREYQIMSDWKLPATVAAIRELSGYDKVLYAHLVTHPATAENPSIRIMSFECGMDMWTVRRSIRNLEKAGLIKAHRSDAKVKPLLLKIDVHQGAVRPGVRRKKRRKKKVRR